MGPQVFASCWNWQTAARRHPRFQMWGVAVFVFLLIELLMPHLSTSLKQSFLDAFGNPSLCGLSGLVSICGEGEFACLGQRKKFCRSRDTLGFPSHIYSCSCPWEPGFFTECLCSLRKLPVECRGTSCQTCSVHK